MKIEYLKIKNYKQFNSLKLDLTYPKGHKKEGQPLDKICIIGQSGTGKTNLLEIIRDKKSDSNIKSIFKKEKTSIYEKIYFSNAEKESKQIIEDKKFIDIRDANSWRLLKEKINSYDTEKSKYTRKLSNRLIYNREYSKEDFILDMKKWESENENILEKIADDINSIIKKFNLELKIDEDTNSYEELIIKDLSNGNVINYDEVSTGTKNLLSTFIPLKSYNPKDSIILIDEPENSFYPDIQKQLTDLYMSVGENNQLIMVTHSPLIASSFEPWEVVELKFDRNNQIYRELYYEGENSIDNYTLDPRMLTWTSILVDIFDLKEDSSSLREKKLMEYLMIKDTIMSMEKGEARDEKIREFKKLSRLLGLQN